MIYIAIWPILGTKCTRGKRQFGNNSNTNRALVSRGSRGSGPPLFERKKRRNYDIFWDLTDPQFEKKIWTPQF